MPMRPFDRGCDSPIPQSLRWLRSQVRLVLGLGCGLAVPVLLFAVAAPGGSSLHAEQAHSVSISVFRVESAAFKEGESIPSRFTCEGEDASPALTWTSPPSGTRSFVLIVEDPDAPAGVWTHWVVYNLPAQARSIDEDSPRRNELPRGGFQGLNSFGRIGYGGPCPPPGNAHRYIFRLYALDTVLSLQPGAEKQEVLAAARGHILREADLMGRFKR